MNIINLLFSMSGRMNRVTYVLVSMIVGVLGYSLSLGFELASATNPEQSTNSGTWVVLIMSLYVQAAMLTKRIRDTGRSTLLVWIYYIGILLGFPLLMFGFVSMTALVAGFLLLGITVIITLYAVFAGSVPGNNENKAGMAFSGSSASSEGQQAYNENADAIIAKALADRHEEQQTAQAQVQNPSHTGDRRSPVQSGFGKRDAPAFGHR